MITDRRSPDPRPVGPPPEPGRDSRGRPRFKGHDPRSRHPLRRDAGGPHPLGSGSFHWLPGRRVIARHRRLLAAVLAAAAVACATISAQPPQDVEILAAARDLPGGRLSAADVMTMRLPAGAVPDGTFHPGAPITGKVISGPIRRGEPLTDVRLLDKGLLAGHGPGTMATPIRIPDADVARLVSSGDMVDVLAAVEEHMTQALTVARKVTVVSRTAGRSTEGALLVLATTPFQAAQLAQAQAHGRLTVAIHPRGNP
jgi:pilus assembly protein CpaB